MVFNNRRYVEVTFSYEYFESSLALLPSRVHTLAIKHSPKLLVEWRFELGSDEEWTDADFDKLLSSVNMREGEIKYIAIWSDSWINERENFFKTLNKNSFFNMSSGFKLIRAPLYDYIINRSD